MHPTEAHGALLTNHECEQGVTLEGPTELYFINLREQGSGGSGSWDKRALLGVTIRSANLIRTDHLCSSPPTPVGQETLDASRECKASGQGGEGRDAGERGAWRGLAPTGPELWQHLGDPTGPF